MWRFIKHHKAIAGYILIVLVVFGQALLPPDGFMIFGDDIHHQYYFYRQFFNEWIGKGIFPWWNPYLFGGVPFVANPVVNLWYPPTWLFSMLPLPIAYSWHLALHVVWAMAGMYVLAKAIMGKTAKEFSLAAWVSGVVFGLSGFFAARIFAGHVDVIATASFLPWVVWAAGFRRPHIVVLFLAAQLFSGYMTMAFFTLIAAGFLVAYQALLQKSIRPLVRLLISIGGGVGLAGLQVVPVFEFFSRTIRSFSFPYSWNAAGSLTGESFIQLISPFYFGNQYTYAGPPPNYIEHAMFIGVLGLVLAAVGIFRKTAYSILFAGLAVFALWISLGPNALFDLQYLLWKIVPTYHTLRIPPRHLILFVFSAAMLAGIGISRLSKTAQKWIALAVIIELVLFARSFITLQPIPEKRHDAELIRILSQDDQPYRVLQNFGSWLPLRDVLDFDSGMAYGIFSATGYDPSILKNYYSYVARASGMTGEEAVLVQDVQVPYLTPAGAGALDFLNIKYILVPPEYDPFSTDGRYRLLKESGYRLYENTTVLPRFFLENPSCGDARITSYTPNTIEVSVKSTCDTNLLSSEVSYPGWQAYVNGKNADISITNDTFRTLFIPSGEQSIVFQYHPGIFIVGGLVSLLSALCLYIIVRANKE